MTFPLIIKFSILRDIGCQALEQMGPYLCTFTSRNVPWENILPPPPQQISYNIFEHTLYPEYPS
jgi:hypothetical protein